MESGTKRMGDSCAGGTSRWKAGSAQTAARVPRPPNPRKPNGGNNGPSNLFNAMISPLIPLSIKGVIWYQGEFNSGGSGKEYATLFSRMITDWRENGESVIFLLYMCSFPISNR